MSKRSVKIDGKTTSLFLEEPFWKELEQRANSENVTWAQYLRDVLKQPNANSNRSAAVKEFLLCKLRQDLDALANTPAGPTQSTWLIEEAGVRRREHFDREKITVGRDTSNDIVIKDTQIAPKHAILAYDGKRWWAVDLNTECGIRLNDKKIQVAPIPRRSEITLGNSQIIKI